MDRTNIQLDFMAFLSGTVLSIPTSGLLAGTIGWESVFYVHGGLAVIWLFLWAILISDSPEMNRFVSIEEKKFISEHHANSGSSVDEKVGVFLSCKT